jgi:hypothetical protein
MEVYRAFVQRLSEQLRVTGSLELPDWKLLCKPVKLTSNCHQTATKLPPNCHQTATKLPPNCHQTAWQIWQGVNS